MFSYRRLQALVLALTVSVQIVAFAGIADARPTGTAVLTNNFDVLAGLQNTFNFTVTNTGTTTVNQVRIGPEFLGDGFTVANGSASGWTFDITPSGRARFTGGQILPLGNASFSVTANAVDELGLAPAKDETVKWLVQASDDGGATLASMTTPPTGKIATTIHVLKVDGVQLTAPNGVVDGTMTSGQPDIGVRMTVSNHASVPLTVTPTLEVANGDEITCTPPAKTIAAGGIATFDFCIKAGNAGGHSATAKATATGADAFYSAAMNYTVQAPAAFSYVGNSLTPREVGANATPTFTFSVAKSNPPAVTFDKANVQLTFTHENDPTKKIETTLLDPGTTNNGTQTLGLTFKSVSIDASLIDGNYRGELFIGGATKDDNDATVVRTVNLTDLLSIDRLGPILDPVLSGPAAQSGPSGEGATCGKAAADSCTYVKNNDTVNFSGSIFKRADSTELDPTASITKCDLVINGLSRIEVPLANCRNNGLGQITGSFAPASYGVTSGLLRLAVTARDAAGNPSVETFSDEILIIDNVAPKFGTGLSGCDAGAAGCNEQRTVRLFLTEPVKGTFSAADFSVDNNVVVSATSNCSATTFCDRVTLTVLNDLPQDNPPQGQYTFRGVVGATRPSDAPRQGLTDQALAIADGIVPDLPTLTTVSQSAVDGSGAASTATFGKQGDGYYTNLVSPTFSIAGLSAGFKAIVAVDTNKSGDFELGVDAEVLRCNADAATEDCVGSLNGIAPSRTRQDASGAFAGNEYDLLIASLDASNNLSKGKSAPLLGRSGRPELLVLDQVAPAISGHDENVATRTVTPNFNDNVARGRDFASDWYPFVMLDGKRRILQVASVSGSGTSRNLTIDEGDGAWGAAGADGVRYLYEGTPDLRYRDRAGNYLTDSV